MWLSDKGFVSVTDSCLATHNNCFYALYTKQYRINVIQYHGAPITALQLTGSFDLPPPQVTVCVDAGSARPRFELTPLAEEALRSRVLRPHKYTWGACYVPPSLRDEREEDVAMPKHVLREHGPVYNQLQRIVKYVERGFSLPDAAAQA